MASVKVLLYKSKQKADGKSPLAIRIIKDRKPRYVYLGYYIHEKDWDEQLSRVKKSHPNSKRLNNLIIKKLSEADDILLESDTQKKNLSSKQVKQLVKGKQRNLTFFQQAEEYITDLIKMKKFNQANSEKSRLSNIRAFNNNEDILFQDITEPFLRKFAVHLRSEYSHSETTVMNHYILIRTLFNRAIKEGNVESKYYPFGRGKTRIKKPISMKIGLEENEIKKIEHLELPVGSGTWNARNIFLFQFYLAGMRISDVLKLRWSDFKDGRLYYTMGKNNKSDSVKLSEKALTILNDYKDDKQSETDYIFPELKTVNDSEDYDFYRKINTATKKLNDNLEKIGELAQIEKKLSTHIARHSFGNIAGDRISPLMLQKLYRHSDIRTTMGYQANFIHKTTDDALDSVLSF